MSEEKAPLSVQLISWSIVLVISIGIAIVLFELVMQLSRQGSVAMRVSPTSYGAFDESLGIRYEPGTSASYAYLDAKGRVLECLPTISRTNSDGFRGLDTLSDYGAAGRRVLVTGDSFSHWNIDGQTIVDDTRSALDQTGGSISLLNVAGGTFGLEHMLVHVADALASGEIATPDLIAIQFIRDDITRGWWYRETREDANGQARARLGSRQECLATDSDCGSDEYLIDARATQSWCENLKGTGETDTVTADLVATYKDIRGFFVYTKRAMARVGLIEQQSVIPRVYSAEAAATQRVRAAADVINNSGATVMLVYLPTSQEIQSAQVFALNEQELDVLAYYESLLGKKTVYPADYAAFAEVSEFQVSPYDNHPSRELQQAYGRYLAGLFAEPLSGIWRPN